MILPVPAIHYPPELPVSQRRDDIAAAIRDHQVVIVAGATGSGKTTQLPKICLELGRESIGHTQPRRLAARTIAERIAEELGSELGDLVGYQVRFTDRVGEGTRVKLMTDGILLNEIHRDRMLRRYDTIIIDEAHERSLTVDFLLGYLKQLLPRRPDLKVVITSATIDPESFARHFADADGTPAPILEVSGRSYPVEIRYRPLAPDPPSDEENDDSPDTVVQDIRRPKPDSRGQMGRGDGNVLHNGNGGAGQQGLDLFEGVNSALDELAREEPGDVLVFLSGENEIRDAEEAIGGRISTGSIDDGTEVLPLYGRLSAADQHRVFGSRPAGIRRRIVLATNVAETSLTVPGIRYVIDAGTARISRYSVRSKIQRLPIEAISQASANQRCGRAGRTSPGIAIRLYSEEDFLSRPEFTEPEILRTNLAAVILQMISLGLGDIAEFPFLQPPDSRGVKDGLDLLRELRAVEPEAKAPSGSRRDPGADGRLGRRDATGIRITTIGRQLARLPIDPRLGRMVIEAGRHGVVREVLAIVAALSIQDPRERPLEKRPQADQAHARFTDRTSDFLTLLNLWRYTKTKEKELSSSAFRRLCKAEYLNFLRIREWGDVVRQVTRIARQAGVDVPGGAVASEPDAVGIHRALLAGLLSQIGIRDEQKGDRKKQQRGDYLGARQVRFAIFPGSALAKKQPAELMSAELVETSRLFARTNAAIDLSWAEPLAGDLAKRSYGEPHWEKKQGSAVAYERVTLYGVPIVARRRVQLSRIDPVLARELFIRSALVEGEWDPGRIDKRLTAFDRANRALRRELAEVEERTRRRDILFDDEAVFEFYDRVLPPEATDQRAFFSWWKTARAETPELLTLTRAELLDDEEGAAEETVGAASGPHTPPRRGAGPAAAFEAGYPDTWRQGDQTLRLSYRFEPGAEDDGVTVHVPLPLLPRLEPAGFDWQVPGLRAELVTTLIKSLPKAIRRNVVPAADWTKRLLQDAPADGSEEVGLRDFLAQAIQRQTYTPVTADDFDLDRVPDHLRATFAVEDERGRRLVASKDLVSLQHKLKTRTRESVALAVVSTPNAIERDGITEWDFGELPRTLDTVTGGGAARAGGAQAGNTIRAYPALVDEGTSVAIRLMATPGDQEREHRRGVLRMLQLAIPSPTSYVQEHLTAAEKLALARSPYASTAALFADCLLACADTVLGERDVRGRADFEAVRGELSASILDSMFAAVSLTSAVLAGAREAEKAIAGASNISLIAPLADAREQLEALVFPGFVARTGLARLRRLPVYLAGVTHRVGRLAENLGRDRAWMTEVQTATERYREAGGELPPHPDAPAGLTHARWLLEELRLSLFAQHLGTAEPVSLQRVTKLLASL